MAILQLRDVNAYYKTVQVLNHVDLEVKEGGVTVILGANGSGKTTTFRAICGITVWTEGSIFFDGKRIDRMTTEGIARLGLGHVPEGRGTFADLTVEENLRLGGVTRRDRAEVKKDILRVYEYFPALGRKRHEDAGNMSGGEQQMLAMGRALMLRPRLLLLDEPSIGLAPMIVKEIFDILRLINTEGKVSILLNEQNANLALDLADQVYVLETGRVVVNGPPTLLQNDDSIRRAYLGY